MSDKRKNLNNQKSKQGKAADKKGFKPEYIAYIVLGVLVIAVIAFVVVIVSTTSGSGGGSTILPPCCQ